MLRLLVTSRWLAATVFVLIAVPACVRLGIWQWDRAHQKPRVLSASEERAVPMAEVLDGRPADLAFPTGLLVRATGHYDSAQQTVRGVDASGTAAPWLVSPLAVDVQPVRLAAVRGVAAPPLQTPVAGDVVVTGRLQPPAPATVKDGLTAEALTTDGFDPRGYLVVVDQQPSEARAATPVTAVPPPPSSPGLRWQNSMYAAQWWIFGCFFVFAWVRFFREDLRVSREDRGGVVTG